MSGGGDVLLIAHRLHEGVKLQQHRN